MENLLPFLSSHPDRIFAAYIYDGLTNGFRIGYSNHLSELGLGGTNHPSSMALPAAVQERIAAEVGAGRLLGPLPAHMLPLVHVSPIGMVPKAHTDKWRMIVDLSHPPGGSVNDGIYSNLCSLCYASVDKAVSIIRKLGRGTQLVKLDIKDAYRIIPVHPGDYHLLGIRWHERTYVDRALPFGLRSAPKIFSAVADIIAWVFTTMGIEYHLHYLDDFLLLGAPGSQQGAIFLDIAMSIFHMLGIPVAVHKTEGPAMVLAFLGILIDTAAFELRLPADKLARLQELMRTWAGRQSCTRKELESLLGHLSHAATVITQGRTFLRQLFPLLSLRRACHHTIRLNAGARADLLWWRMFLKSWNGTSFFPAPSPSVQVVSDASGSFGCGAFSVAHGWFQIKWPESWHTMSIAAKELVPVVAAAAVWGHQWGRSCVCFKSDNMSVVSILTSRTAKDTLLMHLLRCLVFYAASYRFDFVAEHIPGVLNTAADAISRNDLSLFSTLHPQVPRVSVPQEVLELLVTRKPNWGSKDWTSAFTRSLIRESQEPHGQSTRRDGDGTRSSAQGSSFPPYHSRSIPSASSPPPCPSQ